MNILYLHPRAWTGEYPMLVALQRLGHTVAVLEELKATDRKLPGLAADFLEPGDSIATLWYAPREGFEKVLTWAVDRLFKRAFDGRNLGHQMWQIRRACRYFSPDIVLSAEGFSYGIPAALLRKLKIIDIPVALNYIGGDILNSPEAAVGKRRSPLTAFLIHCGIAGADALRPFSPLLKNLLLEEGGASAKISVIQGHMPIDFLLMHDVKQRREDIARRIRQRHAIDPSAPVIISLSGNLKGKGLHFLAQAWTKVLSAVPDARWLLGGPATVWLDTDVWPILENAGVRSSVVATGQLGGAEVFEYLASANLCVMPTLADGGPMSNIESVGVGTPVLTTDCAGNAQWLKDAGCGEFVAAGTASALAEAMIRLLQDLHELRRMGESGPRLATQFTTDSVARKVSEWLTSVIGLDDNPHGNNSRNSSG